MFTLLVASLSAVMGCARNDGAGPRATPGTTPQCTIGEVSREKLMDVRGRQVYIQPVVAVPNGRGEILVVGEHNHVFGRQDGGRWARIADDSLLGAIIRRTGPAELVRSPVPSQLLGSVRAAARDDGTWSVVFAELKRAGTERSDSIARLWYGVLDGARWSILESIPIPSHGTLRTASAAPPVEANGVFSWAIFLTTAEHPSDVLVLQRQHGRWSYEVVPTVFAAYAAIAHPDGSDPLLVVVQPDLDLEKDGNSLFLWARRPGWHRVAKLVANSEEAVHHPHLEFVETMGTLTWLGDRGRNGWHARTMAGTPQGFDGPIVSLDAALARGSRQSTVTLRGLGRVWVLDHKASNDSGREIRLVMRSAGEVAVIGRVPHPFLGAFVAAASSPTDVIIAGGVQDAPGGGIATLVIRAAVRCLA